MRVFSAFALLVVASLASQAQANRCVDQDMKKVESILRSHLKTSGIKPAYVYEGLNATELSDAVNSGQAPKLFIERTLEEMRSAAKTFIESRGNASAVADRVFHSGNRRQVLRVIKRPNGQANTAASASNNCEAKSCADIALQTKQLYFVEHAPASKVVNAISRWRLKHLPGNFEVTHCEMGTGCSGASSVRNIGGKAFALENPTPMKHGSAYIVREYSPSRFFGTIPAIDGTSVFKVSEPIEFCGKEAFVMTGSLANGNNAFDNGSTHVLVIEGESSSMAYSSAQAMVSNGRGPMPGLLLGSFSGKMLGVMAGMYNDQAKDLGIRDRVESNGVLR